MRVYILSFAMSSDYGDDHNEWLGGVFDSPHHTELTSAVDNFKALHPDDDSPYTQARWYVEEREVNVASNVRSIIASGFWDSEEYIWKENRS